MAGTDYQANQDKNDFLQILAAQGVEFLLSGEEKVSPKLCAGKMICLLFSANWCRPCRTFTPQLVQLYNTLQKRGEKLEIIFISLDHDENEFEQHFKIMPWLAVPFDDELQKQLCGEYHVDCIPSLVPLCRDRMSKEDDLIGFIEDYGAEVFPYSRKRMQELKAMDCAKRVEGKLEELLGNRGYNYVISRHGGKTQISELIGKTIGLYFGAYWSPPSRSFTSKLSKVYKEIMDKTQSHSLEVIFVSTDRNLDEFKLNITDMPWLAIPYEDETRQDLYRIFDVKAIPTLVLIGADGKTSSENGRGLVSLYGAEAFPFTEERIDELEAAVKKEAEELPSNVEDIKHEHVLKLELAKAYVCDFCKRHGRFWAFSCHVCDYDLHPTCVHLTNV
ncbi:probable nucleoredoxin 3 isoform X2 [Benincasa hispida]|uniref:probable nucleoredoxin 3 isoform X2 n=1 Tax=Benincasa hispida TaxID=102211 RepID=UPI0018FFE45D|nr:probable nucleoredoxin 3 isoform X2 [Benincasa hispida]XP_038886013.1 probable nucleoredoxin 3 isoform X2 [Benincasa hispida]